jgi:hypothetical protein
VRVTFEVYVAQRMLARKPVAGYKVGHKNASDLVARLVIFNWVGDFSGPKVPCRSRYALLSHGSTAISQIS